MRTRPPVARSACLGVLAALALAGAAHAAAGDLDSSFGSGGKVTTSVASGDDGANDVAVQSDGKIVAVGLGASAGDYDFALARYNADGSLDTTFGSGGTVSTSFGPDEDAAEAVAIQADGKIVVAGRRSVTTNHPDFALARYNADGSLDSTFGTGGKVTTDFDLGDSGATGVGIQSDGKIVAIGSTGEVLLTGGVDARFAVARYNSDGTLDASFGTAGRVVTNFGPGDDAADDLAIQPDGKIVGVGYSADATAQFDFALARYNTDGSLDSSFGTGGKTTTSFGLESDRARGLALQSDGKIVAAGFTFNGSNEDFALARYAQDGSLDSSFGSGGKVTTAVGSASDTAQGVAVQADGRIVAAGVSVGAAGDGDFALTRYNGDGSLDPGFGTGGKVTTSFSTEGDAASGLAIQSDGKILAAGSAGDGTYRAFALARYLGSTYQTDSVSQDVPAGGTVSTGSTPTQADPVETSVTTPNAGHVTIEETSIGEMAPSGYEFVGQQVNITAPDALAVDPLKLVFRLDASILPPGGITAVNVTRNGTLVPNCTGAPGVALPDPCISSRSPLGGGDVQLTILTSKASSWNFAVKCLPLPTPAKGTRSGRCTRH